MISKLLLLCALLLPVSAQATYPTINNWKMSDVLVHMNDVATTIGSGCRIWLESYGSNQFRSKKRCGTGTTASGVTVKNIFFPDSFFGVIHGASVCSSVGCSRWFVNGSGDLDHSDSFPLIDETWKYYNGDAWTVTGNNQLTTGNSSGAILNNYTLDCWGRPLSVAARNQRVTNTVAWTIDGAFLASTSSPTVSSGCTSGDTLIVDYGVIQSDCTSLVTVAAPTLNGSGRESGSCGCIPIGSAIETVFNNGICAFVNITGDPGTRGNGVITQQLPGMPVPGPVPPGTIAPVNGNTFTNDDLTKYGPSTGVPVAGTNPNGGFSEGTGLTGPLGGITPGAGAGAGGTGNGSGSGPGNCSAKNCNDDMTPDVGFIPGTSTFDSTIAGAPTAEDWVSNVNSFLSGSPVAGVINGSTLSASGSCSATVTVMGATVDLGFCSLPSSFFTIMGAALLVIAHLTAFFIIFK